MENTWLDPEFAITQLMALFAGILFTLLLLPVILGGLVYGVLTLLAWFQRPRRAPEGDYTDLNEGEI
jgi:hypothetical protein